jgi:YfiH family protein
MKNNFIVPDWPAPPNVHALQTTRQGGLSLPPYDALNLGSHVGDDPLVVERNRNLLNPYVPSEPIWLEQVHGTHVVLGETAGCLPKGDACVARSNNTVCAIMTADCLPVLLCADDGSVVGAAHAGWRGLADGVIEQTVEAMRVGGNKLLAWLGPAIGPEAFEVGDDVREVFVRRDPDALPAFKSHPTVPEKFLADLYLLARQRLNAVGATRIYGGEYSTYSDPQRFYSYRRDGRTGRMATLIWKA